LVLDWGNGTLGSPVDRSWEIDGKVSTSMMLALSTVVFTFASMMFAFASVVFSFATVVLAFTSMMLSIAFFT